MTSGSPHYWREADDVAVFEHAWLWDHMVPLRDDFNGARAKTPRPQRGSFLVPRGSGFSSPTKYRSASAGRGFPQSGFGQT